MVTADLVVEDALSESLVRRLTAAATQEFYLNVVYSRGGNGHIKENIARYNAAAKRTPFIVVTDLDYLACPSQLISDWLKVPVENNMLFRIAVREAEAWVLGDRPAFARLLGIGLAAIPARPETLRDPKLELLTLAKKSRIRRIREGLVREDFPNPMQGPDYNGILTQFVASSWNPDTAQDICPSLKRMRERLNAFAPILNPE